MTQIFDIDKIDEFLGDLLKPPNQLFLLAITS